jgi:hypothetical protein
MRFGRKGRETLKVANSMKQGIMDVGNQVIDMWIMKGKVVG